MDAMANNKLKLNRPIIDWKKSVTQHGTFKTETMPCATPNTMG